ncbi:cytochrome P450 [Abortiporus biennis]|nr:cytochrome P450 [Abortiporus biennis]
MTEAAINLFAYLRNSTLSWWLIESIHSNPLRGAFIVSTCWVLWILGTWLYNIYFHPLRRFPGPKVAAATDLWKAYIEIVQQRGIVDKLFELHRVYGDIVRIGPNELHFANPTAYDDIYNMNNRWTKEKHLYNAFGEPGTSTSSFTTREFTAAKKRKDILTPLFSRRAIIDLQSLVQENIVTLCDTLTERSQKGVKSNLELAFKCFSMDTITSFCFSRSMNALHSPNFSSPTLATMKDILPLLTVFKHFPLLHWIVHSMPTCVTSLINPSMIEYQNMTKILANQIDEILSGDLAALSENAEHPIIYHRLISSGHEYEDDWKDALDNSSQKALTRKELLAEAWTLIYAGTDTVANALTMGCFHIFDSSNVEVYEKLKGELKDAWPVVEEGSPSPTYEELERLPYLKAVIKESLRLNHGVISPMTRYVPSSGAVISGVYIPGGTTVSISNAFVHLNEHLFPDPMSFKPERWLNRTSDDEVKGGPAMDIVSFGKGPRSCLGINLAYCELYIAFANFFRRFEDVQVSKGVGLNTMIWKERFSYTYYGPAFDVITIPTRED